MSKFKHLTIDERSTIKVMLDQSASFKAIGRALGRDCSTISKEVRNHIIFQKKGSFGHPFNDCADRYTCKVSGLCANPDCHHSVCSVCPGCYLRCYHYKKVFCPLLQKPPYVCNGCTKKHSCTLEKRFYSATYAQKEYQQVLSESRSGLCISEEEALWLDEFVSPLIKQGLSIHHICQANPDSIMFSEKTIYNYVDAGIFSARNIDLPRKVRYKPRKSPHDSFKVDRGCRVGRTYQDFLSFLEGAPDCPIVQIDTVEGSVGGKVLLTVHFVKSEFMLAFLRNHNTAASVSLIFERLYQILGHDTFTAMFPVILADNGTEFSDPSSLEVGEGNSPRTRVFYCNPSSPYQKGSLENNHEFIRRFLPRGTSFDELEQDDINRMMNHINSYIRANLGNRTPYEMFRLFYGQEVLNTLGAELIPPNDVLLRPELLK